MQDSIIVTDITLLKKIYTDLQLTILSYYEKSYPLNMAERLSQYVIRQWSFAEPLTNSVLDSMAIQYLIASINPVPHGGLIHTTTTQSTRVLLTRLNTVSRKDSGKITIIAGGPDGEH